MIEILQRFYKLVILGTLGMTRYGNQQWYYQLEENFDAHLHAKSETYPITSFLKYCMIILHILKTPAI